MTKGFVRVIVAFIAGMLVLPVIAFLYIWLGYAPVATAAPPLPLERSLAKAALSARISREAPKQAALPATEANLVAGARVYREYCAVCHGMAGQPKTATAKGMFPRPPQLVQGKGVTDDPVGETYWKAANGIRLTGMPAYRGSLTDEQLWQVSQLLAEANHLPAAATEVLSSESPSK